MNESNSGTNQYVEIRVEGHLDPFRTSQFGDMQISWLPNGQTLIAGQVSDQAALFGILIRIRDMGIPLCSVHRAEREG